ncbi:MAG: AAA family ATPase [Candidatus Odinarchaeota archaeon]
MKRTTRIRVKERFAIWLVPDNSSGLSDLISDLSSHYNTPEFTPHITLIDNLRGPLDVLKNKLPFLTKKITNPLKVKLASTPEYDFIDENAGGNYRSLFFYVEKSERIKELYDHAINVFSDQLPSYEKHAGVETFTPHITVLPGYFFMHNRGSIIEEFKPHWIKEGFDFYIEYIHLVKYSGMRKKWKKEDEKRLLMPGYLQRLQVENFKSLKIVDIPLKRFNVFIGPNNSGKSSILQTLLFLSQSYTSSQTNYTTPYDFGGYEEVLYNKEKDSFFNFELSHDLPVELDHIFKKLSFGHQLLNTIFDIFSSGYVELGSYLEYAGTDNGSVTLIEENEDIKLPYFEEIRTQIPGGLTTGSSAGGSTWLKPHRELNYNDQLVRTNEPVYQRILALNQSVKELNNFYRRFFTEIVFIPTNRGDIRWFTETSGSMPAVIDVNDAGHSLYNTLFHMTRREHKSTFARVKRWTKAFGIDDLTPYPKEASKPSCGVETVQRYSNQPFQLVSLGFGARQILFLLVKAIMAPQGSIILIEEPEIHLHPAYQVKIIDFLIEMAQENKQILVTTHSEYLILQLQNAILKGDIAVNNVALFSVYQEEGQTRVKELDFSAEGSYELPGFYDITQEQLDAWLKLKTGRKRNKDKIPVRED